MKPVPNKQGKRNEPSTPKEEKATKPSKKKAKEPQVDLARIEYGKYVADVPIGAELLSFEAWQRSKASSSEALVTEPQSNIAPSASEPASVPTEPKAVAPKAESKQPNKKAAAKPQKTEVVLLPEAERRELRRVIALEHNSLRKEQRTATGKRLDEIKSPAARGRKDLPRATSCRVRYKAAERLNSGI